MSLQTRRVDTTRAVPLERNIITIGENVIGTTKNFGVITGSPKSGKSRFISAFLTAGITGIPQFSISVKIDRGKTIGHFDTEQGETDILKSVSTVKTWCGMDQLPPGYDLFSCREDGPEEICKMVDEYIEPGQCQLLILDGILDMIIDYNDIRESRIFMNWIKRITKKYDLFILAVIHLGKSEGNTLGHIGSMCDRYCQAVIGSEKETDGTYTLKPRLLRSAPGFDPINIRYDGAVQMWLQNDRIYEKPRIILQEPKYMRSSDHADNLKLIFNGRGEIPYSELLQSIIEIYGSPKAWAKLCVRHFIKDKFVTKSAITGNYYQG